MSAEQPNTKIAIACQGGGSHAAFAAGALEALLPELDDHPSMQLVGLSGTSGGAICALLGWYGMLEGGSATAQRKLEGFWTANCAQLPGEALWNRAVQNAASPSYEILFSPYQWPGVVSLNMLTSLWPAMAACAETFDWPPINLWGRGNYFQLDQLIKPHLDYDLIGALGAFCSIPHHISRWSANQAAIPVYGQPAPGTAAHAALKQRLETLIRDGLAEYDHIERLMERNRYAADAPLRGMLKDWPNAWPGGAVDFDDPQSVEALNTAVTKVMLKIPKLLLGAVDVLDGEFVAFSSQRSSTQNGISPQAVLASAALPWLVGSVDIRTERMDGKERVRSYWDGLFSQNPPIKNFISGSDNQQKPDEIWLLQINPIGITTERMHSDIWDRRNELSGNLSLNQEIGFIGAINKRLEAQASAARTGGDASDTDKHVLVHRIIMDGDAIEHEWGQPLNALSKCDRDARLGKILRDKGVEQARRFLMVRPMIEDLCSDVGRLEHDGVSASSAAALDVLKRLSKFKSNGGASLRLIVDETIMPSPQPDDEGGKRHDVLARWHWRSAGGASADMDATVEGEIEFDFVLNGALTLKVREVRIIAFDMSPVLLAQLSGQRSAAGAITSTGAGTHIGAGESAAADAGAAGAAAGAAAGGAAAGDAGGAGAGAGAAAGTKARAVPAKGKGTGKDKDTGAPVRH